AQQATYWPTQMAEALAGLGVAASVIAVLQISEKVISACYQYYRTTKNAGKDIHDIINIVSGLKTTLENLRPHLDDQNNQGKLPHLESLNDSLDQCKRAIVELASKLGVEIEEEDTDRIKVTFKKKLMWPWREKQV